MTTPYEVCKPNPCECPEVTDTKPTNEAGQPAISYRLGTHAAFLRRMLDKLHTDKVLREKLTTRETDDPAIAMMDAWAVIGDVLSFYQERIANEGFLRTATERRSILEMARTIGYELNPGLAASTYLAFTVDDTTQMYSRVTVPEGTKVQSLPSQGKLPQTFETIGEIEARAEWNALKPQQTEKQAIKRRLKEIYLKGTSTQLQPGDAILIVGDERDSEDVTCEHWDVRVLTAVKPYPEEGYTRVTWAEELGYHQNNRIVNPAAKNAKVYAFRQRAALFGQNAPDWKALPESVKVQYLEEARIPLQWRSGATPEDDTDWQAYGTETIYLDVDTSAAGFTSTPLYITSLGGDHSHWEVVGATSIYDPTKTGFRIYLRSTAGNSLTPDYAKSRHWHIQWLGIETGDSSSESDWPVDIFKIQTVDQNQIDLDAAYTKVVVGSWVALVKPGVDEQYVELYKVTKAMPTARTDFTVTSKVTRLELDTNENLGWFGLRETVVFCQSEELELAEKALTQPVHGDHITLGGLSPDLSIGQALAISGKPARVVVAKNVTGLKLEFTDGTPDVPLSPGDSLQLVGPPSWPAATGSDPVVIDPETLVETLNGTAPEDIKWQLKDRDGAIGYLTAKSNELTLESAEKDDVAESEAAFIADLESDRDRTTITLSEALEGSYDRTTVSINGNVAEGTHGETIGSEVLGSGDGARTNQSFTLKKPPLTYVSAETVTGGQSTLIVRVNGVRWLEAASLYGLDARSRNYAVRIDNDAKATVTFGDGKSGARLPSGTENVVATYRHGLGPDGNVDAGTLTLLQTRPTGIRGVSNPIAATGGTAAEEMENARRNAPLKILTLDRIVSIRDYEDFARAFTGIGKAQAVILWNGETDLAHITVAGSSGEVLESTSTVLENLVKAIDKYRNPMPMVQIDSFDQSYFCLKGRVLVDPAYVPDTVLEEARSALAFAFAFDQREFGQPVTSAEVISTIQQVPGVTYVDLDMLYLSDPEYLHDKELGPDQAEPAAVLPSNRAQWTETKGFKKARLLLIDPDGIELEEMKS